MRYIFTAAIGFALIFAGAPAFAQMSMGGSNSNMMGGNAPKLRPHVPDIAPPALPGAGIAPLATGPALQKPITGDPTTALFAAVNSGDYNAAQDAVSRGANMNAKNALGETPLNLSVALNRSSITFMLLSARNEGGGDVISPGPAFPPAPAGKAKHDQMHVTPAKDIAAVHETVPVMGNNPGKPDPSAGFLGFGPKG